MAGFVVIPIGMAVWVVGAWVMNEAIWRWGKAWRERMGPVWVFQAVELALLWPFTAVPFWIEEGVRAWRNSR